MFATCKRSIFLPGRLKFSLSSADLGKSYYDTLGVTPHATQNDIKAAYYKLSMMYHPDKNKGSEEASQKFRDITEAYEILGNFRLKKLYDKGLLSPDGSQYGRTSTDPMPEDDEQTKFYKSRFTRDKPPTTGRTPIYNFDEWSHAHYGDAFARRAAAKERFEQKKMDKLRQEKEVENEFVVLGVLLFVLSFFAFTRITNDSNDISGKEFDGNEVEK
ncbi:Protein tumorous imaginal discs, mitochondrial [Gryllus bimaculatus]|nr:Protein tumorous imaginal discs, mitochondrial [Gryllus bimaculatus]